MLRVAVHFVNHNKDFDRLKRHLACLHKHMIVYIVLLTFFSVYNCSTPAKMIIIVIQFTACSWA